MIPYLQSNTMRPSFQLDLVDSGAGVVNTNVIVGLGSATFTRATSAWTRLASGLWAEVASGSPRSYYLSDGTYAGYLAEGARTNLAIFASDLTNAAWTKSNMTVAKTATGPDGVANSATTCTATAGNATALQAITSGSASRIACTFIKRRTGSGVINITQDNGATWTVLAATNDWQQLPSTNQTLTNPTVGIRIVTSGDAVDIWTFMNEVATFPGTPIPTTDAAVTRNADVLTYAFAGNASATVGSCYAEASTLFGTNGSTAVILVGTTTANAPLFMAAGVAATRISIFDGTTIVNKTGLTSLNGSVRKVASSWGGTGQSVTGDGLAVGTGAFDGDMGNTAIGIGCFTGGANNWFGTAKNVRIWQRQLADSVLASLTA